MRITQSISGTEAVLAAMAQSERQARFAMSVALNRTAVLAADAVRATMPSVFDRPTPWVIKSLRVNRSTKANLVAEIAYKDKGLYGSSRTMIEPHVHQGVKRQHKAMETRLQRAGHLPSGWYAVPGSAAKLDSYGNMSQGQISQLLNVLGTYTESGYNKANAKTSARLARGDAKKGLAGFVYWINPAAGRRQSGLPPGVYQRVGVGSTARSRPVLVFVRNVSYRPRLDFYGIAGDVAKKELPAQFDKAFSDAMRSSILRRQGSLL